MAVNPVKSPLAGIADLTDTVDAIYRLRLQGSDTVLGVFKEIQAEQALDQKIAEREQALRDIAEQTHVAQQEADALAGDPKNRTWLGSGRLKKQAAQAFAEKNKELQQLQAAGQTTALDLTDLKDPHNQPPTQYGQLAEEKKKLRALLDMTPEEHRKSQADMIAAAQNFVDTSQQRIASALAALNGESSEAAALAVAQQQEALRHAAQVQAWENQVSPTTAPVTVKPPLKLRHAGFITL